MQDYWPGFDGRPPRKVLSGTPAWVQTDLAPHTGSNGLSLRSTLDAICSLLTDISSVNWWAARSYTRLIRDHLECAMGLDGEDTLQAQIIEWVAQWIGGTVSIKLRTQLHMQMSGGVRGTYKREAQTQPSGGLEQATSINLLVSCKSTPSPVTAMAPATPSHLHGSLPDEWCSCGCVWGSRQHACSLAHHVHIHHF